MKNLRFLATLALTCLTQAVFSQGFTRQTYHDKDKKSLKESYQVNDTVSKIPHGNYVSYFLNGNVESRGQFTNNETSGVWEFYYETGKVKMRGILFKGANYGMWEYFFESGKKSMEGIINGRNREGEWKMYYENGQVREEGDYKNNKHIGQWTNYFEDGTRKGQIEYADDHGRYTEYYHSGKVRAEGPRTGVKNVGFWRYFADDGTLQSSGEFTDGKKNGPWTNFYPSGKPSSRGAFINDQSAGKWEYLYEDGSASSIGDYLNGKKDGHWKSFLANGKLKSEIVYQGGAGEYREYYESGKLKIKGKIVNDKRQGTWEFLYDDGQKEGICEYENGKGTYTGYYPSGTIQTKGPMDGDLKTGTWEIYEVDGTLSGYYRPFYDDKKLSAEITTLASKPNTLANLPVATTSSARKTSQKQGFSYFDARHNEFQGVIFGTNPMWLAAGEIPLGVEFYLEERIGHEFEFIGIRDPFFTADTKVAPGKVFDRGYSIAIKQKFYNAIRAGMWYFGQEIRFTNLGHFVNQKMIVPQSPDDVFTFNSVEQRIEWGALLGYRIMRRNNTRGFTIDAFISGDLGYRAFDVDENNAVFFDSVNQNKFSKTFHIGLNFGNVFSFR